MGGSIFISMVHRTPCSLLQNMNCSVNMLKIWLNVYLGTHQNKSILVLSDCYIQIWPWCDSRTNVHFVLTLSFRSWFFQIWYSFLFFSFFRFPPFSHLLFCFLSFLFVIFQVTYVIPSYFFIFYFLFHFFKFAIPFYQRFWLYMI